MMVEGVNIIAHDEHWVGSDDGTNDMGERADSFETEHFSTLIMEEAESKGKVDQDMCETLIQSNQIFARLREEIVTPVRAEMLPCFSDATLKILFNSDEEKRSRISGNDFSESELHSLLTFLSNEKPEGPLYSKCILDLLQGDQKPVLQARAFDEELSTAVTQEMSQAEQLEALNPEKAVSIHPENIDKQKAQTQAVAAIQEIEAFASLRVALLNEQAGRTTERSCGSVRSTEAPEFNNKCLIGQHLLGATDDTSLLNQPVMCDQCSKDDILKLVEVGRTLDAMGVSLRALRMGAPVQNDSTGSVVWKVSELQKSETLTQIAEASEAIRSMLSRALLMATALETQNVASEKWVRLREMVRPMVFKQAIEVQQIFDSCECDLQDLEKPSFTGLAIVEEKMAPWVRLREKVDLKIDSITAQFSEAPKSEWNYTVSENVEEKSNLLEFLIDYGFQQWMSPKSVNENQSYDFYVKEKIDIETRRCRNAIVDEEKAKDFAKVCPDLDQTEGDIFGESGFADVTQADISATSDQSYNTWVEGELTNEVTASVEMECFFAPESRYGEEDQTEKRAIGTKCSPWVYEQPWPKADDKEDTKIHLVPISQATLQDQATSQMHNVSAACETGSLNQSSADNLEIPKEGCERSQYKGADNKMGESGAPLNMGFSFEVDMDWARPREEFGTLPDVLPSNAFSENTKDKKNRPIRVGQAPLMDELGWMRSREADKAGRVPTEVPGEQSSFENRVPHVEGKPKIKGRSLEEEFSWMRPRELFDDLEIVEEDVAPQTLTYEEFEETPKELIFGISKEEEDYQITIRLREKIGMEWPKPPPAENCEKDFQENQLEEEKGKIVFDTTGALPLDDFLTNGWFDMPLTIQQIESIFSSDFIPQLGVGDRLTELLLFATLCHPHEMEKIWSRPRDYCPTNEKQRAGEVQYFSSFEAANKYIKSQEAIILSRPKSEQDPTPWRRSRDMPELSRQQLVSAVVYEKLWNQVKSLSILHELALARESAVSGSRVRELVQQSLAQAEISVIHEYFEFPEDTSEIFPTGEKVCLGREEMKDWMRLRESIKDTYVQVAKEINGAGKFTDLIIESVKDIQGCGREEMAEATAEMDWMRPREKFVVDLVESGMACVAVLDIWTNLEELKDTRGVDKEDSSQENWARPRESIREGLTKLEKPQSVESNVKPEEMSGFILACGNPRDDEDKMNESGELETPDSRDNTSVEQIDELNNAKIQKVPKLEIEKFEYHVDENETLDILMTLDQTLENVSLQIFHDSGVIEKDSDDYKIEIKESKEDNSTSIKLTIKACKGTNVGRFKCLASSDEAIVGLGFTVALNQVEQVVEIKATEDEDVQEALEAPEERDEEEIEEEKEEEEETPELENQNEEDVKDDVKVDEIAEDMVEELHHELKPTEDDETQESAEVAVEEEEEPEEEKEEESKQEQQLEVSEVQDEDIEDELKVKEDGEDVQEELREEFKPTEDDETVETMEASVEEPEEKEQEEVEIAAEDNPEAKEAQEEDVQDEVEVKEDAEEVEEELKEEVKPTEDEETEETMEAPEDKPEEEELDEGEEAKKEHQVEEKQEDAEDDLQVEEEKQETEEELREELKPTDDEETEQNVEVEEEMAQEEEPEEEKEAEQEPETETKEDETADDELTLDETIEEVAEDLKEEVKPTEDDEVKDEMEVPEEENFKEEEEENKDEPDLETKEDDTEIEELQSEEKTDVEEEPKEEPAEDKDGAESEEETPNEAPEKEAPTADDEELVDDETVEASEKKDVEQATAFGPLEKLDIQEPLKLDDEVAEQEVVDDKASITSEEELENLMSNQIAESSSEHSLDESKMLEPSAKVPTPETEQEPAALDEPEPQPSQEAEPEEVAIKIDIEQKPELAEEPEFEPLLPLDIMEPEKPETPVGSQEMKVDLLIDDLPRAPQKSYSEEVVDIRIVDKQTPQKVMQSESVDLKILDLTEDQEETRVNINIQDRQTENQVQVMQSESVDLKVLDLFDDSEETFVNINVQDRFLSDQVIVQVEQPDSTDFSLDNLFALTVEKMQESNLEEPVHLDIQTQSTEAISSVEHVHLSIDTSSVDITKSTSLAKVSVFEENMRVFSETDLVEVLAKPQESVNVTLDIQEVSKLVDKQPDTFAKVSITDAISTLELPDKEPVQMAITSRSTEAMSAIERVHLNIDTTSTADISKSHSLAKVSVYEETGKLFTQDEKIEVLASPHESVNVSINLQETSRLAEVGKNSSVACVAITEAVTQNQSIDGSFEVLAVPQTGVNISIDQTLAEKLPEPETFATVTVSANNSQNFTTEETLSTLEVLSKGHQRENVNISVTTDNLSYMVKPADRAIVSVSEPEFQEFFSGSKTEILATPKPAVNITFLTESISHMAEEKKSEYNFLDIRNFKPERHQSKVSLNAQPLSRSSLVLVKTETETIEYMKDVSEEKPKTNLSCVKVHVSDEKTTLLHHEIVKAQAWISEERGKTVLNLPVPDNVETSNLERFDSFDSFTGTVFPFVQGSAAEETQAWMQCLDKIQLPENATTCRSVPREQKRQYLRDVLYNSVQENTSLLGSAAVDQTIWTSNDGNIARSKATHGVCLSTRSALAFYSAVVLRNITEGSSKDELLDWHDSLLNVLESVRPGLQSTIETLGSVVMGLNDNNNMDVSEISSIVYEQIMEFAATSATPPRNPRLSGRSESPVPSEDSEHGVLQDEVLAENNNNVQNSQRNSENVENVANISYPPVFTSPQVGEVIVEPGQDFTAEFFVDCPPNRTSIQILKDGERFYEPRNVHTDINYAGGIEILMHFFSVEQENCGFYTLRAQNSDGTDVTSFSLRIQPRASREGVASANKAGNDGEPPSGTKEGHIAPIKYEILDSQPEDDEDGFGFADDDESVIAGSEKSVSKSQAAGIQKENPRTETFIEYPKQILSAEVVDNNLPISCFSYVSEICNKSVQDVFSMINEVQNVVSKVEWPMGMSNEGTTPIERVTVDIKTEGISYEKHLSWENLLQEVVTERNPLHAKHTTQLCVNVDAVGNTLKTEVSRSSEALGKDAELDIPETTSFNQCAPKVLGIATFAARSKTSATVGQNNIVSSAMSRCDSLLEDEIRSIVDKHLSTENVSMNVQGNTGATFRSHTSSPVSESAPDSKFVDWIEVPIMGFNKPTKTFSSGSSFSSTEKVHVLIKISENNYLGGSMEFDNLGNIVHASVKAPKYQSITKAKKPVLKGSIQWPSTDNYNEEPMTEHKPATVFKVAPRKGFVKRRRVNKGSLDGSNWSLSSGDSYDLIPTKYLSNVSLNCYVKEYRQFEAPPAILTKYPSKVNIQQNNDVKLNVKIAASDDAAYMWYKNGKPVKFSSRLQVNVDEAPSGTKTASLTIKNCNPEDEGNYLLRAVNDWGEERVQTRIQIDQSDFSTLEKSFISEIGIDLPDDEARKKLNTLVRVISNESLIDDDELIFPIRSAESLSPLTAEKVLNKIDATKKNAWTSQSITALLDDYRNIPDAAPVFLSDLPEQNYLKSGNDVHISVKIASSPNANLVWKKDGQELPTDLYEKFRVNRNLKWQNQYTSLVILNADKNDTGNYECVVETDSAKTQTSCLTTKITVEEDVSTCPERISLGTQISKNEIVRRVRGNVKIVIDSFSQSCKPLKSSLTTKAYDESCASSMEDFIVYANVYESFECHAPKTSSVKPDRNVFSPVTKPSSVLQASTHSLSEREEYTNADEQHSDLTELFCTELKTEVELTNESFGYSSTLDINREEFYQLDDITSPEKETAQMFDTKHTAEHRESALYQSSIDIKTLGAPQEMFTADFAETNFDLSAAWSPEAVDENKKIKVEEVFDSSDLVSEAQVSDLSKTVFCSAKLKSPEAANETKFLDVETETTKAKFEQFAAEKLPASEEVVESEVQVLVNPPSTETSPASSYDNLEDYDYGNVDEDLCKVAEEMQKQNAQKQQKQPQNFSTENLQYLEQSLETITEITEDETISSKGSFDFEDSLNELTEAETEFDFQFSERSLDLRSDEVSELNASSCESFDIEPESLFLKAVNMDLMKAQELMKGQEIVEALQPRVDSEDEEIMEEDELHAKEDAELEAAISKPQEHILQEHQHLVGSLEDIDSFVEELEKIPDSVKPNEDEKCDDKPEVLVTTQQAEVKVCPDTLGTDFAVEKLVPVEPVAAQVPVESENAEAQSLEKVEVTQLESQVVTETAEDDSLVEELESVEIVQTQVPLESTEKAKAQSRKNAEVAPLQVQSVHELTEEIDAVFEELKPVESAETHVPVESENSEVLSTEKAEVAQLESEAVTDTVEGDDSVVEELKPVEVAEAQVPVESENADVKSMDKAEVAQLEYQTVAESLEEDTSLIEELKPVEVEETQVPVESENAEAKPMEKAEVAQLESEAVTDTVEGDDSVGENLESIEAVETQIPVQLESREEKPMEKAEVTQLEDQAVTETVVEDNSIVEELKSVTEAQVPVESENADAKPMEKVEVAQLESRVVTDTLQDDCVVEELAPVEVAETQVPIESENAEAPSMEIAKVVQLETQVVTETLEEDDSVVEELQPVEVVETQVPVELENTEAQPMEKAEVAQLESEAVTDTVEGDDSVGENLDAVEAAETQVPVKLESREEKPMEKVEVTQLEDQTVTETVEEDNSIVEELKPVAEAQVPVESENADAKPMEKAKVAQLESQVVTDTLQDDCVVEELAPVEVAEKQVPVESENAESQPMEKAEIAQFESGVVTDTVEEDDSVVEELKPVEVAEAQVPVESDNADAKPMEKAKVAQLESQVVTDTLQDDCVVEELAPVEVAEKQVPVESENAESQPMEKAEVAQFESGVVTDTVEEDDSVVEELKPVEVAEAQVPVELDNADAKPMEKAKVAQLESQVVTDTLQDDCVVEELAPVEVAEKQVPVESENAESQPMEKAEVAQFESGVVTDTVEEDNSVVEELKPVEVAEAQVPAESENADVKPMDKAEVAQLEYQTVAESLEEDASLIEELKPVEVAESQVPVESVRATKPTEKAEIGQLEAQATGETLSDFISVEFFESIGSTETENPVESLTSENMETAKQSVHSSLYKTDSLDAFDMIHEEIDASSNFAPLLASADLLDALETESVQTSVDHSGVNSKDSSLVGSPIEDLYLTPEDEAEFSLESSDLASAIQNLVEMADSMTEQTEDIQLTEAPAALEEPTAGESSVEVVKSTLSVLASGSASVIEVLTNLLEPSESELASVNALRDLDEARIPSQQAEEIEIMRALDNSYVILPEAIQQKEPELFEAKEDDDKFIVIDKPSSEESSEAFEDVEAEATPLEFVENKAPSEEKLPSPVMSNMEPVEENEAPVSTDEVPSPVTSLARICMADDFGEIEGSDVSEEELPEKEVDDMETKGKLAESSESEISEDDLDEIDVPENECAFKDIPQAEKPGVCKDDDLEDFLEIEDSDISEESVDDVECQPCMQKPAGESSEDELLEEDIKEFEVAETESAFLPPHLLIDSLDSQNILESPEERKQKVGEENLGSCEANEHFDFDDSHSRRIASSSSQTIPLLSCEKTHHDVMSEKANEQQIRLSDWLASERGVVTAAERLAIALDVTPPESEVESLSDLEKYLSKATHYSDAELVACDDKIEITTFEDIEICEIEKRVKTQNQKSIIIIEEEVINFRTKKPKKPKIPVYKDSKKSKIGDKVSIHIPEQVSDEEIVSRVTVMPKTEPELAQPANVVPRRDPNASDSESYRTARDSLPSSSYRTADNSTNRALSFHTVSEDVPSVSLDDVPSIDRHESFNSLNTFSEHESSVSSQLASEKSLRRDQHFDLLQRLPLANMVEYHQKTTNRDELPHKYVDAKERVFTDLLTNREAKEAVIESNVCQCFTMTYERAAIKDHIRQLAEDEMFIVHYSSESGSDESSPENSRCTSPLNSNGVVKQTQRKVVTIKADSVDSLVVSPAMSEQCLDLIDKESSSGGSSSAASDPILIRFERKNLEKLVAEFFYEFVFNSLFLFNFRKVAFPQSIY